MRQVQLNARSYVGLCIDRKFFGLITQDDNRVGSGLHDLMEGNGH